MGNAPAIAEKLSHNPNLLDVVLTTQYYGSLQENMDQLAAIAQAEHFEEAMLLLRKFNNEKQFQVGVQLLKRQITTDIAGIYLTSLAENVMKALLLHVEREFAKLYGVIPGAQFAIIALGKLGAREMTFNSDLDLVFVYDVPQDDQRSDGERGFTAPVYYNRMVQRFVNAMTTLEREGRLYNVDTRLRPSGKDGPLAVSFAGFEKYFNESAWTFEFMALSRARVVAGSGDLKRKLEQSIHAQLSKPHDPAKLAKDIADMRRKIDAEFGTENPWRLKYVRGGMMDLDFIAQYFLLRHAHSHPKVMQTSTQRIFLSLLESGLLDKTQAQELLEAAHFLSSLQCNLRLCSTDMVEESSMSQGLKKMLTEYYHASDFDALRNKLKRIESTVLQRFGEWIAPAS